MDDVALLTRGSDYSRFMAPNVVTGVKNAALKKLFADPRYNVMDGLDVYIDDYTKPDPIPQSMLRQMVQSKFLGLFADEEQPKQDALALPSNETAGAAPLPSAETAAPTPTAARGESDNPSPDEDTDLRLQQDDAALGPGADEGARPREV